MKDNKIIAEFMGEDVSKIQQDTWGCKQNELQYHTSWNWLMPVVKECLNVYHIEQKNDDLNFKFYDAMGNLELTYKAVVEFIKEYNNEAQ